MGYKEIKGNIFNSKAMAIVNTVNCVGVMGKGIALEFRLRFPEMFKEYEAICANKLLKPGQVLPYRKSTPWVLNFAIKDEWTQPSKPQWIESTLKKFCDNYKNMGITSAAFPVMGAMNGGLPVELIWKLTRQYLSNLEDIEIEVYDFDSAVSDNLFDKLKLICDDDNFELINLIRESGIKKKYWLAISECVRSREVGSLHELINFKVEGKHIIGKTNISRLYQYLTGITLSKE